MTVLSGEQVRANGVWLTAAVPPTYLEPTTHG